MKLFKKILKVLIITIFLGIFSITGLYLYAKTRPKLDINSNGSYYLYNINDELFNYYFNLGSIINSSCKMILKLENIYDVLFYINRNIKNFNKDELILSKSILKTTKYVIDKAKNQKNVKDEVLSYCDNLQNEIKDKLKEPNL